MGLTTEHERGREDFYMQGEKQDSKTDKNEESTGVAKIKKRYIKSGRRKETEETENQDLVKMTKLRMERDW